MSELRSGYTTGSCAAAAARGAVLLLCLQRKIEMVSITLPGGEEVLFSLTDIKISPDEAVCGVIKDAGDDPDATHGLMIKARARWAPAGIKIEAGEGIGRVTKSGLQVPVGQPAINPVPRRMIMEAVADVLPPEKGVEIFLSVPGGEEAAKRTMNAKVGVVGGISILGTRGIVRPMSEEDYCKSLLPQLGVAKAAGFRGVVLTPGQMGESFAVQKFGFPADCVVQMSNFVGYMLKKSAEEGFLRVLLFGHHGKLVKVAGGIFHTHSSVADGKAEILSAYAAARGADRKTVQEILNVSTAEGAIGILRKHGLLEVFGDLAEAAARRAREHVKGTASVNVAMLGYEGDILGMDRELVEMGGIEAWRTKCL